MLRTYRISVSALRWLRTLAERAQKSGQREIGGLIVSEDGERLKLVYLSNEALRPCQFLISEKSHKSAVNRVHEQGMQVLGDFHSHPISEAIPGPRDIQMAKSGSLMLIYDVCGRQARLWEIRASKGRRHPRELALESRSPTSLSGKGVAR